MSRSLSKQEKQAILSNAQSILVRLAEKAYLVVDQQLQANPEFHDFDPVSCSPKIEPVYKVQSLTERGQFYDWDEEAA